MTKMMCYQRLSLPPLLLFSMAFLQVFVNGTSSFLTTEEEDLELERHLKTINKSPLKTIIMDYGDTIDCVDMKKQPAFDHPLLKNHTIQINPNAPSSQLTEEDEDRNSNEILWAKKFSLALLQNKECPPGSIPIRRTTKQDLMRARTLPKSNVANNSSHTSQILIRSALFKAVAVGLSYNNGSITSVSAASSVWNFPLEGRQMTTTQLWVQAEEIEVASLETGWMIYPQLYGDSATRLFIHWVPDFGDWCYDLRCPGFVQTTRFVALGMKLPNISTPNGPIFELHLKIYQDSETRNWWLYSINGDIHIGYWPAELFPSLSQGSKIIAWGGLAYANFDDEHEFYPPMGSGSFADPANYKTTGYFAHMAYDDYSPSRRIPIFQMLVDPHCYGLHFFGVLDQWGRTFSFGGPSKICH